MITKLDIIKNDEKGIVYDCDGLMYVAIKKVKFIDLHLWGITK